ncbi:MAG: SpoIIE family protein phosphatase, partial [Acidobacteria bacterium]|nr:SpoIIE family protein phosphatase [Acidobacteriota bacterium]
VGGDYFDVRPLGEGRVVLVVADVSGKGVPAALMVATLHSALLLSLDGGDSSVDAGLFRGLNRHLVDLSLPNKFITLLLVELDLGNGCLRYLNAGHNPGLLLRADGELETLGASGPPLGLLPGADYRLDTLILRPGDLLCLYSDGITECSSPADEEFGVHRLEEALRRRRARPLPILGQEIEALCRDFAQGQAQGDDQTLVLLRRS